VQQQIFFSLLFDFSSTSLTFDSFSAASVKFEGKIPVTPFNSPTHHPSSVVSYTFTTSSGFKASSSSFFFHIHIKLLLF